MHYQVRSCRIRTSHDFAAVLALYFKAARIWLPSNGLPKMGQKWSRFGHGDRVMSCTHLTSGRSSAHYIVRSNINSPDELLQPDKNLLQAHWKAGPESVWRKLFTPAFLRFASVWAAAGQQRTRLSHHCKLEQISRMYSSSPCTWMLVVRTTNLLTHWGLMAEKYVSNLDSIGLCNGLLPVGTKPLPDPMWTFCANVSYLTSNNVINVMNYVMSLRKIKLNPYCWKWLQDLQVLMS